MCVCVCVCVCVCRCVCVCVYGIHILISKNFHIAFLVLKIFNSVFSLILVILSQVYIKFSLTSNSFLYAQYI